MKRGVVVLLLLVLVSTGVRVLFALDPDVDPLTGPDSPTYHAAATDLAEGGFDGTVRELPRVPVGYPAFVAAFYEVFGVGTRAVGVIQGLLVGAAAVILFLSTRHLFGTTSWIAAALLTLSPGLSGASAHLMYEPLLAFLLMCAVASMLKGWYVPALGVVGLASIVQPKCLVVGVFFLAWLMWQHRKIVAWSAAGLLVAPLIMVTMNHQTYGHWGISANFGMTIQSGFNDAADGTWRVYGPGVYANCPPLPSEPFAQDRVLTKCALSWMADHPERLPQLTAMKAAAFWSPLSGPLTTRSTWPGDFDVRYLYPAWVTEDPTFQDVDLIVSNLWILLIVALLIWGALLVKDPEALLILAPVVAFFVVTLGTIGDARFRLPVVGFCLLFQSRALVELGRVVVRLSPTLSERAAPNPLHHREARAR